MTETGKKKKRVLDAYEGFVKQMKNFWDEQQYKHEE